MNRARLMFVPTAVLAVLLLLLASCGGGDESGDAAGTGDDVGTVVADESSDSDEGEELTLEDIDGTAAEPEEADDAAGEAGDSEGADDGDQELTLEELQEGESSDDGGEDRIEVSEADEDPIDSMLNAVTVFGDCIGDRGFDLDTEGFPSQDGSDIGDFDPDYVAALQACATSSGILDAMSSMNDAQDNLTPEQIRERNFGLPVFTECMERLGWEMGELTPDERGLLNNSEFTPPDGGSFFDGGTDAINECRQESEAHVEANYVPGEE